jgi:hypothetical protein
MQLVADRFNQSQNREQTGESGGAHGAGAAGKPRVPAIRTGPDGTEGGDRAGDRDGRCMAGCPHPVAASVAAAGPAHPLRPV